MALEGPPGTQQQQHKLRNIVTVERAAYFLIETVYYAFVLAFSLLSTSAVVYTIASFYTARDIAYRRIMSVVPKVWRRLMVTLLCAYATFFACAVALGMSLGLWSRTFEAGHEDTTKFGVGVLVCVLIGYLSVFVYMATVWQMASVVSVMEDVKGFKAVLKGWRLVRGKVAVCVIVSVNLVVALVGLFWVFIVFAMANADRHVWRAVAYGGVCMLLFTATVLFGMVVQTVIYMVCKSYHHETIDKSALADHLEGIYLGEYVPLKGETEMGEYHA